MLNILSLYIVEWIFLPDYFGLVQFHFLFYPFIYYVAQKGQMYFICRLPLAAVCL